MEKSKRIDTMAPTQQVDDFITFDSKTGKAKANPMFHIKGYYKNVGLALLPAVIDDIENIKRVYDEYTARLQVVESARIEKADAASDVVSNPTLTTAAVTIRQYLMQEYDIDEKTAASLESDEQAKIDYADYLKKHSGPSLAELKAAKLAKQAGPSLSALKQAKQIASASAARQSAKDVASVPATKAKNGKQVQWAVTIGKQRHDGHGNKAESYRALVGKTLSRSMTVNGKTITETKLITAAPKGTTSESHYFDELVKGNWVQYR